MKLDCVGLTQSSVIRIIHRNVCLKLFFQITKIFVTIVSFCLRLYFTRWCRNAFTVW